MRIFGHHGINLACLGLLFVTNTVPACNLDILLPCLAAVESSGETDHRTGRQGERTMYQIRPETWCRFSAYPMPTAGAAEIERCPLHSAGNRPGIDRPGPFPPAKKLRPFLECRPPGPFVHTDHLELRHARRKSLLLLG